jgi:acyl carrier protein
MRRHPGVRLLNAYGPTECSDDVTHHEIREEPPQEQVWMPIGLGVRNTRLYVVDKQLELVPEGVLGELLVGGICVGRGYLDDGARTAEAFVPDSLGSAAGQRLYRTGDLVRWRAEGVLEYLGRVDQQVKVRGYRIELGEVEAALGAHSGIRETVVEVRGEEQGERRLVAYLVAEGERAISVGELRSYLQERLLEYMVPASYVWLERLPLTSNGKVDRRALPEPEPRETRQREYLAPEGETQETLARIWEEVLGVEGVGQLDEFFELGGHSLLGTQVISRIRATFHIEVPLRALFIHTTLAALSEAVEEVRLEERRREDEEILDQLDQLSEEEAAEMSKHFSLDDLAHEFDSRPQTLGD